MAGAATRGCNICLKCRKGFVNNKSFFVSRIFQSRCASSSQNISSEKTVKKRDKYTVLKALSSTVGELPDRPDYRFFDDVILNARTSVKTRELSLALESGTKAAEYVLEQYPDLVRLRQPVPAWPQYELTKNLEPSKENLKILMKSNDKIPKVIEIYEALKVNDELTIEEHNEMLAFAAYHSLPSSSVAEGDEGSSSSPSNEEELSQAESTNLSTWRSDGYAEQLFSELKEVANAQTYEAFILGLLKHGEYIRAFELFNEFKDRSFKGSLFLYETLINHVVDVRTGGNDRWELIEDIVAAMDGLKPTSVTFTNILSVTSEQSQDAPKQCQRIFGEMKKLKIVPSLGSLYYLLAAERNAYENRKDYIQNMGILYYCVNEIQKGDVNLEITHPADVEFFHNAMHLARFKRQGNVAEQLLDLIMENNLHHMLGAKAKMFFGNFLAAVARSPKDMEAVIKQYDRIVPNYLIPHDWVYEQLFFASRNNGDVSHIPRLFSDMVKYNVYIFNRKMLPSLYLSLDCQIPEERAGEFLQIIEQSKHAIEIIDVTPEVRQQMLTSSIKIYCLNGKVDEAFDMAKSFKCQGFTPTYKSLLNILEGYIKQNHKESALQTIKLIASSDFNFDDSIEEIITNSFLADETDRIKEWYTSS